MRTLRSSTRELHLDVVFGERYPRWNAVYDTSDAEAVALAERVHAEVLAERAHDNCRRRRGPFTKRTALAQQDLKECSARRATEFTTAEGALRGALELAPCPSPARLVLLKSRVRQVPARSSLGLVKNGFGCSSCRRPSAMARQGGHA